MSNDNSKTILLVEDEAIIAMMEKNELEKYGYHVHYVTSGERAVQTILENEYPVDLILMDIDLGPGIDGTEAADQMLNHKDLPIVFLSSHTEPEMVQKTENITSYGYVVKNSGYVVLDTSIKMALKLFDAKAKQKKAEETIQEKDTWLNEVAGIARVGGWKIDSCGNTLEWTDETYRIHDLPPTGNPPNVAEAIQFYHKEDRNRVSEAVQLALETGEGFDFEARIITAKQNLKWVRTIGYTKFHERSNYIIWGTIQDITDRKQDEIKLKESEDKFKKVFEDSSAAKLIIDPDNNSIIDANISASNFFGWTQSKLRQMKIQELSPLSSDKVKNEMYLVNTHKKKHFSFRHRLKDGSIRDADLHLSSFTSHGKKMFYSIIHDITEKKTHEKALRDKNNLLYKLLDNSLDLIALTDLQYNYTLVSKSHEILGYDREYIIGKNVLDFVQPEDVEPVSKVFTHLLKTGQTQKVEYRCKHIDGEYLWVEAFGTILKDEQGDPEQLLFNTRNITERKKAENELREHQERLIENKERIKENNKEIKKQLSEKETLLREVHHRIKNNIASIEALLSFKAHSTDNAEAKSILQDAISCIQSTHILYEKLLISKSFQEVSIKDYIDGLLDSLIAIFPESRNISIERNIEDFTISSKKVILLGIIINELLTNAFKYAFEGKDKGEIFVEVMKTENHVTLAVKDNGFGISERVDANESSGFGIELVKMIAKQLEGTFTMENDHGTKSVLKFDPNL